MYDILGDKCLLKSAASILIVCNKQGQLCLYLITRLAYIKWFDQIWSTHHKFDKFDNMKISSI